MCYTQHCAGLLCIVMQSCACVLCISFNCCALCICTDTTKMQCTAALHHRSSALLDDDISWCDLGSCPGGSLCVQDNNICQMSTELHGQNLIISKLNIFIIRFYLIIQLLPAGNSHYTTSRRGLSWFCLVIVKPTLTLGILVSLLGF